MPNQRDNVRRYSWRFGLRCLFSWVLVVGVALGWWLDHLRSVEKMDVLNERIHCWSIREQIMEAGLTQGGFKVERKVVERGGKRGMEFHFTSPDGDTYEGGAIVVSTDIDEFQELNP